MKISISTELRSALLAEADRRDKRRDRLQRERRWFGDHPDPGSRHFLLRRCIKHWRRR